MGEVYRARDTRLDRTVALKILPAAFSADPDRLHRFQHEAKLLSTLNHPNVLAIYDVGEQNGIRFLVSEFLEGQSLREVLATGTLPRRKLIEYALDVAKGLAAAHEKGIVHRDLKPDNVFITRDDRVKVLDFGLAKQAPDPASESATMTGACTHDSRHSTGHRRLHVARASPRTAARPSFRHLQLRCSPVRDGFRQSRLSRRLLRRNDECHPQGGSPELSASGFQVSPGLDRIIRRCLEKKPERRFQSASDLAFALDALSATSGISQAIPSAPLATKKSRLSWILAAIAALAVLCRRHLDPQPSYVIAGTIPRCHSGLAYIRTHDSLPDAPWSTPLPSTASR